MTSTTPQKSAPILPPQQHDSKLAEQPQQDTIPVYGYAPPPPAPLVSQPGYAYNPQQQQSAIIVDPIGSNNNNAAANIPTVPTQDGEEVQRLRAKWRRVALGTLIGGVLLMILGISFIKIRKEAPYGACCLPAGCDVSKLHDLDWDVETAAKNVGRRCTFTSHEMLVMGCADQFNITNQCTLSAPSGDFDFNHHDHDGSWDPCGHNAVVGQMLGAGISVLVVGALCVITALCFFFWGVDCYGGIRQITCCNWFARISTGLIWQTAFGGAICGIVFGSMSVRGLTKKPFQTRSSCDLDSDDEYSECKDYHDQRHDKKKDDDHHPIFWEGPNCTVAGEHAEVFSFIEPSESQKAHAGASVMTSVAFTVLSLVVLGKCIVLCCRRCNKKKECDPYATTEMTNTAAVQNHPVVNTHTGQPIQYGAPQQQQQQPYPMNADGHHHNNVGYMQQQQDQPVFGYPVEGEAVPQPAGSHPNYGSGNNREEHQSHPGEPVPGAVVTKADPPMIENL